MMLRLGRVVGSHPEDYSVDVVMTDDGAHLAGVQVLSPTASKRGGFNDLPVSPGSSNDSEKWDISRNTGSEVIAAIAFFDSMRMPVVVGFLYPQVNQMLFAEPGRKIDRHESDVYVTIASNGDTEVSHPSGAFVRIAETPGHEDLTGKDFDKKWHIDRNTGKQTYITVENKVSGAHKASITLTPDGHVMVHTTGDVRIVSEGETSIEAGDNVEIKAGDNVKMYADGRGQFISKERMLIRSIEDNIVLKSVDGVSII